MKKLIFVIIISVCVYFSQFLWQISLSKPVEKQEEIVVDKINDEQIREEVIETEKEILETIEGPMTLYGPNCNGCSGITASGYDVRETIYYNDPLYGELRILAADSKYPFGTIVEIIENENIIQAIVLDRGSNVNLNGPTYFDLLVNDENNTSDFGIKTATFNILRLGF